MSGAQVPRAVVFDFDGTLIDSLPLVLAAIGHAIEPFGGRPTMDIFASLGGPPARFMTTLLADQQHLPIALERMERYHRENVHLVQPYAGVTQLLDELNQNGIKTALWTGRDRVSCDWLLREHQLTGYFAAVVCGDDLPTHKPDPEGLREIMRQLGVSAADTLLVGDADVDVLGGVACGVDTVLIRHTREIGESVAAKCWRMVTSPAEAFKLVIGRVTAKL
jgi:HAD superfamily hydrolase (TIGR01509 family)